MQEMSSELMEAKPPKLIFHLKNTNSGIVAMRAAKFLLERPDREDALLEYTTSFMYDEVKHSFYVKRNKASITVWQQ